MKTAGIEMRQALDEAVVLETLRIEQTRAIEGAKRTRQGREAIDWGGTEEAHHKAEKERIRAEKTEIARKKSKLRVKVRHYATPSQKNKKQKNDTALALFSPHTCGETGTLLSAHAWWMLIDACDPMLPDSRGHLRR